MPSFNGKPYSHGFPMTNPSYTVSQSHRFKYKDFHKCCSGSGSTPLPPFPFFSFPPFCFPFFFMFCFVLSTFHRVFACGARARCARACAFRILNFKKGKRKKQRNGRVKHIFKGLIRKGFIHKCFIRKCPVSMESPTRTVSP